jgi:hypothetical protein
LNYTPTTLGIKSHTHTTKAQKQATTHTNIQGTISRSIPNNGEDSSFLTKSRILRIFDDVYNIKMDLLEIGVCVVDWVGLTQDRYSWRALVNSVMNLRVP